MMQMSVECQAALGRTVLLCCWAPEREVLERLRPEGDTVALFTGSHHGMPQKADQNLRFWARQP